MSMREALVQSQNVPAVRLAAAVGPEGVRDLARRAGMSGDVPASPVAALGVTAASPLELAVAYASFVADGVRPTPRFVLRVEDADGDVVLEREEEPVEVTSPATAYLLTDMLRDAVDLGTGRGVRSAGFWGPAAGKTGTTNDATDVWFVGYTPELVGAVWAGFDEPRPLPLRATGGGVAAPVWGRIMARVYSDRAVPGWPPPPDGVVALWIDPETGMALADGCRPGRGEPGRELFLEGDEPAAICPHRGGRSFLDEVGHWFESVFGSSGAAPRIPGEPDPDLGVPRLPGRGEVGEEDGVDRRRTVDRDVERAREALGRMEERAREERERVEERIREARRRAEEELREALKRQEEAAREALKRQEEAAREARKRAEERRRDGGGG